MHRRQFIERVVAAGAAVLSGCSAAPPANPSSSNSEPAAKPIANVQQMFGGKEAVGLFSRFDKAEAFRIQDSEYQKTIDAYTTVSGPVALDQDEGRKLANLLSDEKSYLWELSKACGDPVYGVRIRFTRGEATLDVLFCFKCDVLLAYWNGKSVGGEDFDPIQPHLVALMKSLFPQDDVIQKLKEREFVPPVPPASK